MTRPTAAAVVWLVLVAGSAAAVPGPWQRHRQQLGQRVVSLDRDDGFGPEAPRDAIIDPGPGIEFTAFVSGVLGRAVEVIPGLADTDRMVIVLKYYHGLKLA